MKKNKQVVHIISQAVFTYSLLTYIILLLTENLRDGFVSYFFNLHMLLVLIVLSGIGLLLTPQIKIDTYPFHKKEAIRYTIFSIFLAFGGSLLVIAGTQALGGTSFIIGGCAALLILLACLLIYKQQP